MWKVVCIPAYPRVCVYKCIEPLHPLCKVRSEGIRCSVLSVSDRYLCVSASLVTMVTWRTDRGRLEWTLTTFHLSLVWDNWNEHTSLKGYIDDIITRLTSSLFVNSRIKTLIHSCWFMRKCESMSACRFMPTRVHTHTQIIILCNHALWVFGLTQYAVPYSD